MGPLGQPPEGPLELGRQHADLGVEALWLAYYGLGGSADIGLLRSWLSGEHEPSGGQHDVVAHALNERFVERGMNHPVAYTGD